MTRPRLIIAGYWFDWTGFNGYNKITVAHTISGTNAGTVTKTEEYQPGKALWDWMQLLIIPAVLAVAGYVINLTISRGEQTATEQRAQSEREAAEKRAETEREIALDNQREAALQRYIDNMSELLLIYKLRDSKSEDEVRRIGRVRTLTVLPRLDPTRKASVLLFLHESGLIDNDKRIIDLSGANLTGAILDFADLRNADLSEANLCRADLNFAFLSEANLIGTDLSEACLEEANLNKADLTGICLLGAYLDAANLSEAIVTNTHLDQAKSLKGATMPDGSIHP